MSKNAEIVVATPITRTEIEAMIVETRAENAAYLTGRSEEAVDVAYHAAMYSMRRLANRLYKAGCIVLADDSQSPSGR